MPTVKAKDGLSIYYDDDDFTDPWKESPVVFLHHGIGTSGKFWYSWIPPLASDCRVIRIDARGWGRSRVSDTSTISLDRYLADIEELLDTLGVDSVHYCGQSLGGTIGVAFAARHPERVKTLTLVSSPTRISVQAQKNLAYGYSNVVEAMENLGAEGWVRAGENYKFPPDVDPGLREWCIQEGGKSDVNVMIALARQFPELTVEPLLAEVKCPTMLLYPEDGHIADEEQRKIFSAGLRDVRIVLLPGKYHRIASLYPRQCAEELLAFIRSSESLTASPTVPAVTGLKT